MGREWCGGGPVPDMDCGGFAVDYRSNFGYNTTTVQEFVKRNAVLKVQGNVQERILK